MRLSAASSLGELMRFFTSGAGGTAARDRQAESGPCQWESWGRGRAGPGGPSPVRRLFLCCHLVPWRLLSLGPGHRSAPSSLGRLSTASLDALCLPRIASLPRSLCSPCKPHSGPCASYPTPDHSQSFLSCLRSFPDLQNCIFKWLKSLVP